MNNGHRHIEYEDRERTNAENDAWHERLARFAPTSVMDRMVDAALGCKHEPDEMEDGDND